MLSNIVDYGMTVQQAIQYYRMFARGTSFELEWVVPGDVMRSLEDRGHHLTRSASPLGTSHAIWIDRDRELLMGGSGGRRDGLAIGY